MFFVNLKVTRTILWRTMERRGVTRGLIERTKEMYEKIENIVVHVIKYYKITNDSGKRKGIVTTKYYKKLKDFR